MTLNDIIVSALAQLDRGHDAQTMDLWRDKFTRFANDAILDLAAAAKPTRSETVNVTDGALDLNSLSRACLKPLCVKRAGKALPSKRGRTTTNCACPTRRTGRRKSTISLRRGS